MCQHQPHCPAADASDHDAARIIAAHPEQGWALLCNGIVRFDDDGELLPDGRTIYTGGTGARLKGFRSISSNRLVTDRLRGMSVTCSR